jgi:hypothetical protein
METVSFEVGDQTKVKITSLGGDLRLSGREDSQFEAKAPSGAELIGEQKKDLIEITCTSDCLIFLPREAQVEGETVGGNMRATNITGSLLVRTVGGDVGLRGVGQAAFNTIGGDLQVRKGTGNLSVDRLGGDAFIDRVSGDVHLRSIGGDLSLRRVDGLVDVMLGGDAALVFTTLGGERVSVNAGGDLSCRLPENASARVQTSAGGEVHYSKTSTKDITSEGEDTHVFGDGEVEVQLNAGGDIWVGGLEGAEELDFASLGASIAEQVESNIEAGMAEMEASLEALGSGLGTIDSERIGEQVRRAVGRARKKANRAMKKAGYAQKKALREADRAVKRANYAQRRALRRERDRGYTIKFDTSWAGKKKRLVTDEERLSILRMLEKGTITIDEAEKLLQALEGEL